jgi:hypothetical protein
MTNEARIALYVFDTGPLITLAAADSLDYLLRVPARFVQNCTLIRRPGTNNEPMGVGHDLFIG